ncbi:MAG: RDD family protein [Cellvibrio sp.]|uniref:RDD family protein n=1 Tax=Cellvibrio sp. TaxID=1965322 RepID=UPI0031A7F757
MDINTEQLAARFRLLETHELLRLSSTELSDAARAILQQELTSRDIPSAAKNVQDTSATTSQALSVYASLPERAAARLIDIAIIYLMVLTAESKIIPTAIPVTLIVLYTLFQDSIFYGKSIGKFIMKITVLREKTKLTCSPWQSLVRNCFFIVLGIIDLLLLINKKNQRIGDWAARTVVINDKRFSEYQSKK